MKIMLVDGFSIAYRAFYGMPLLSTKEGIFTNAIYGFLKILFNLLDTHQPDALAVAFDFAAPTFRHQYALTYKATRKPMPSELQPQIPLLQDLLSAMGISHISAPGFEADDILGTLATAAAAAKHDVLIVSGDRDLLQIATDSIQILIPKTKQTGTEIESYYASDVVAKYGVIPTELIDVKALMGDASDNIPGVKGVGEKTALKLIAEYKNIDTLYANLENIKGAKLKENLATYKDSAYDSKFLATIKIDIPINFTLQDFSFKLEDNLAVRELFEKLEFKSLLTKFSAIPATPQVDVASIVTVSTTSVLADLDTAAVFAVLENDTLYMGVADGNNCYFIAANLAQEYDIIAVKNFFEAKNISKILHNSKDLRHILYRYQINIHGNIFDTAIASYLINPLQSDYELSVTATGYDIKHVDQLLGTGKNKITWASLASDIIVAQLGARASAMWTLQTAQLKELTDASMLDLFYDIEMPLIEVLFDMEIAGITVDAAFLTAFGKKLDALIATLEQDIYSLADEKFNISSSKQLGLILFDKLGIPAGKKTKTGYSTAANILDKLKDKYVIVAKVLEYRQYKKLHSTYVVGLLKLLDKNNKLHSTFNQTVTATGRISSAEPNLQNIPIRLALGKEIRRAFIPSNDDYVFLDADYSQIELRVLASLSADANMQRAFLEGIDIHTSTASEVFGVDTVTQAQRNAAKAVNFGVVYGISAFSLADDIQVSNQEATEYIENYFTKYPNVKHYLDSLITTSQATGYGVTLLNRKRNIVELFSSNFNTKEYGKRIAMNMPIQGTAADIIKKAMIQVHNALKGTRSTLILTVHDELLLEVHKSEIEHITKLLKTEMESAVKLAVPLLVDVKSGDSWFAAK